MINTEKKSRILCIVGPTASGKTSLSIELAKRLSGEIISCDSMQIYRGMDIGTAKPTKEELMAVPHHLIDIKNPEEIYSCADYVVDAKRAIAEIQSRGKLPIFCGGTGLYLDRLLKGGTEEITGGVDEGLREELYSYAELYGAEKLHEKLREVDPQSADIIHHNNIKRVVRALEIYKLTGKPKSELDVEKSQLTDEFDFTALYLHYEDRNVLYNRIERRVDQMMCEGLLPETIKLFEDGVFEKSKTAAQAIGYKELLPYIKQEDTLERCTERLKINTRKYAKRQLTWFSSKEYVEKVEMMSQNKLKTFEDIVNISEKLFNKL